MQDSELFNGVTGKYTDCTDENSAKKHDDDMEIASSNTSVPRPRKKNIKIKIKIHNKNCTAQNVKTFQFLDTCFMD